MNEFNIEILTESFPKEERKRIITEHKAKMKWAQSLTKEEINFLCDAGFYNDAIKGYLITAAKNAGLDREQIKKLLDGLYWAFDEKDKVDAEEIYKNF